eukprot:6233710-Amphidinium_carterae.1
MPVALGAKAGLQATKVRAVLRYGSEQYTSRIPFDFVIGFAPREVLPLTEPASFSRNPGKT